MLVFEIRKLFLWPSKHTLTKKQKQKKGFYGISSIYPLYNWEEIFIIDVKETRCTCSKQNVSAMLVFEMRKLCLWPSKHTLTKKKPNKKKPKKNPPQKNKEGFYGISLI